MPYISATAEIIYAPLDLRLVMENQFATVSSQSIFSRDFSAKSGTFAPLRATVMGLHTATEVIRCRHTPKNHKEMDSNEDLGVRYSMHWFVAGGRWLGVGTVDRDRGASRGRDLRPRTDSLVFSCDGLRKPGLRRESLHPGGGRRSSSSRHRPHESAGRIQCFGVWPHLQQRWRA